MEHGLFLVTEDDCQGYTDHESLDALSGANMYPDILSPVPCVSVLHKTAKDAAHST